MWFDVVFALFHSAIVLFVGGLLIKNAVYAFEKRRLYLFGCCVMSAAMLFSSLIGEL